MKIKLILIGFILLCACSDTKIDEKKFYDTYKEILDIRAANEDTTVANPLVREVFTKNKYSEEDFKNDYFELAKDPQKFIQKVDSIRQSVE